MSKNRISYCTEHLYSLEEYWALVFLLENISEQTMAHLYPNRKKLDSYYNTSMCLIWLTHYTLPVWEHLCRAKLWLYTITLHSVQSGSPKWQCSWQCPKWQSELRSGCTLTGETEGMLKHEQNLNSAFLINFVKKVFCLLRKAITSLIHLQSQLPLARACSSLKQASNRSKAPHLFPACSGPHSTSSYDNLLAGLTYTSHWETVPAVYILQDAFSPLDMEWFTAFPVASHILYLSTINSRRFNGFYVFQAPKYTWINMGV